MNILEQHPVLGTISPDPVANMLGTGFSRFEAEDFAGLVRFIDHGVDVLAIVSQNPGSGKFPLFIDQLQADGIRSA